MSLKEIRAKMFENRMVGVSVWIEICPFDFEPSTWRESCAQQVPSTPSVRRYPQ